MAFLIELEHLTEQLLKVNPDNILSVSYETDKTGNPCIKLIYKKGGFATFPKTANNIRIITEALQETFNSFL